MVMIQYYPQPIQDVIRSRISIRAYDQQVIPHEITSAINNFIPRVPILFDGQLRVEILQIPSLEKDAYLKLGAYSMIRGTNTFLAATHPKGKMNLLNAGYVLEHAVLYAQALSLGSCWLVSTFNRDPFTQAMQMRANETLPAIVALGFPQPGVDLIGGIVRTMANSRTRKNWKELFFDGDFNRPLEKESAGKFADALDMLRLAPSANNRQPWRIVKDGRQFHFFIYRPTPPSDKPKPGYNVAYIDCGIGMAHFELTNQANGIPGRWVQQEPQIAGKTGELTYVTSWQ
jgi:nitroreductase